MKIDRNARKCKNKVHLQYEHEAIQNENVCSFQQHSCAVINLNFYPDD